MTIESTIAISTVKRSQAEAKSHTITIGAPMFPAFAQTTVYRLHPLAARRPKRPRSMPALRG